MKQFFLKHILIFVALVCCKPLFSNAEVSKHIVVMGEHHGEYGRPLQLGTGWLALVKQNTKWKLSPTRILTKKVFDSTTDNEDEPIKKSGDAFSASKLNALSYVRHPSLKEGVVKSATFNLVNADADYSDVLLPSKGQYEIDWGKNKYILKLIEAKSDGYKLVVVFNNKDYIISTHDGNDQTIRLLWAGDLNNDSRIDFIIQDAGYNFGGQCLYLSNNSISTIPIQIDCHKSLGC